MRKKYGQNFLINSAVRTMLLDALQIQPGNKVWEIGPGLGAMTISLLQRGANITAFEVDPAFCSLLCEAFADEPAFKLVPGDVLKTWIEYQHSCPEKELFLLGNLPYNIAATLLADFIERGRFFNRMVVTVQREVARRMAAKPGSADYSSFSVLCSSVYKVKLLSVIKGSSFYPIPNVDSQAVCLDLLQEGRELPPLFHKTVRALFSSRRKKLRNTLSRFASSIIMNVGTGREAAEMVLKKTGISGDRRAETLEIHEFAALSASLQEIKLNGT